MTSGANLLPGLARTLQDRACEALAQWHATPQQPRLLKYRENAVFKVQLDGKAAALRLHRPGYHGIAALSSELAWVAELARKGMNVPSPLSTPDGRTFVELPATAELGIQYADIMSWIDGRPLGETGVPFTDTPDRLAAIFTTIGATMADLHNLSDNWSSPSGFARPAWNADGLLGEGPLWGRFWDCDGLSSEQRLLLGVLRRRLRIALDRLQDRDLDYGLIHADLVRENIFVDGDTVAFIDFDDAGFGWRMFDVATALLKNRREPHYDRIVAALVAGYRQKRQLSGADLATLPFFLVLRSLTYIGWIAERPEIPDAAPRLSRFVDEALSLAGELDRMA